MSREANDRLRGSLDLVLVALPPAAIALGPLGSFDLPMHLAIGDWILDHRALPGADPFSFTAAGAPWVPHEWLAEVLLAAVERAGGLAGLELLAVLSAVGVALAHRLTTRGLGVSSPAHLAWSVPLWLLAGQRIMLRPHLPALSFPFLAWWLLLRGRERPRALWGLPLLMAIWVNFHGSFPLGFAIITLDLVACGRWHAAPRRTRWPVAALSLGAILAQLHVYAQPHLLAGLREALGLMGSPVFMQSVVEWRSPLVASPFHATYAFWLSLPWAVLACWGAFSRGRQLPLAYRLFAVLCLVLYLRHQRFLALFALASLPLLPLPERLVVRAPGPALARVAALAAGLLFLYPGFPVGPRLELRKPQPRWGRNLPLEAVAALRDAGYRGGVFCEYEYGATVAWAGRGALRPTMDSRNSVYGEQLFVAHRRALVQDTPLRRQLLEQVGAVLLRRPDAGAPERRGLVEQLEADPRWQRHRVTGQTLLYLKSGAAPAAGASPSLVLVTIDTLRADHLQSYGYFRQTSPHFDRFAADALLFERTFAPVSTTLPVHVSLLTGTHPLRHGVVSNSVHFEEPAAGAPRTAAQMLRDAGYRTAAFTSAAPLARGSGIEAGFEVFRGPSAELLADRSRSGARAEETVDAALAWLAEARSEPFFLWVHLFDPHGPYTPPPPYDTAFAQQPELLRFLRARGLSGAALARAAELANLYDGEILYADSQLGRLLDALAAAGAYARAVVVVTGDHGEGILQHGWLEHGQLWNEQLAVPLALRWPAGPRGRRRSLASPLDVLPTLAAHAGLPLDAAQFDGVDLLAGERDAVLSQRPLQPSQPELELALRIGRWKYWKSGAASSRLFDLARDPHELRDVRAAHPEVARRLEAELQRRVEAARARPGMVPFEADGGILREKLRALGYAD